MNTDDSPLRTATVAGPVPLYGTCRSSMPVSVLKSSVARCEVEPLPPEA